ncbi:AAA family ATPase [Streptomyces sp. NPDC021969]|uniref:AAA family ATPase n=1 Tax=unclassified Streptomyces TaxID=2593676 RepID=UPI003405F00B
MLAERHAQIERLCAALEGSAGSTGDLGVITGGVACGKTELLDVVSRRLGSTGIRVLRATCSPAEQALPYGMIDQLFRGLALAGELPIMSEEIRKERESETPPLRLLHFFYEVLTILTAQHPVLLSVDGIEYADEHSLHCLLYLYRRIRTAPASILVTHTTKVETHTPAPLDELLHQARVARVTVGPLTVDGVAQLLRGLPEGTDRAARDVWSLTGGNPLLVRALL